MPERFARLGICFDYPENWVLDETDARSGREAVTVYSPGGAFWSVSIHPRTADLQKLAQSVVEAMRAEYALVEVEEVTDMLEGRELAGLDMTFYYLDFVNAAQVRVIQTDWAVYTVFCQAEDREFDRTSPVFQAMTVSLLRAAKRS